MDERVKPVFAVFDQNGKYVVRYDRDAVKSILKLRKALLDEAVRLMTVWRETNGKKKPSKGKNDGK